MGDTEKEELELGTDLDELRKLTGQSTLEFEEGGKLWRFAYREVGWIEHFDCIERAWAATEQGPVFQAAKYYEDMLMLALVSGPGGASISRPFLRELRSGVISKLTTVVPSPLLDRELEKTKKG